MTDIMSEASGREIVARDAYEKDGLWMPLLAANKMNAAGAVIRRRAFTNGFIQGPALVVGLSGPTFESFDMGAAFGFTGPQPALEITAGAPIASGAAQ